MNQPRRRPAGAVLIAALLGSLLALGAPGPVGAAVIKPIMFPVDGAVTYIRDFGAPRSGHTHEGNDLIGKKMLPLLAAVDGVVFRLTFNNTSSGGNSVTIKAADGWTYHYLHVNNDTPGTDNGLATRDQAFPSTVVVGATVKKGQVIAYMGDSGNAESTSPHLHFEIRQPALSGQYIGTPIDPYDSLQAAIRGIPMQRWELRRTSTAGPTEDFYSWGIQAGDRALLCDWDGDGLDESVIFRAGVWHLRDGVSSGATISQISFGAATDTPLCGNIDADPADEPLLFAAGQWTTRAGFAATDTATATFRYGVSPGDVPVLGDWDGNGRDDAAIYRAGGAWHIRSTAVPAGSTLRSFTYGTQAGDRPMAGDWDGNGTDDLAIYRGGQWHLRSNAEATGRTLRSFVYGAPTDQPVAGRWTAVLGSGLGVFRPKTA
jgi:Peptidase family M23